MFQDSSLHTDIFSSTFAVGSWSILLMSQKLQHNLWFFVVMQNILDDDAINPCQVEHVWLNDRPTAPLSAFEAPLSIYFEIHPHQTSRFSTSFFFKVESEDNQSIVWSPLPLIVPIVFFDEFRASVVFAFETKFDHPSHLITVLQVIIKGLLFLAEIKCITSILGVFQFIFDDIICMFGGVRAYSFGSCWWVRKLEVELTDLLAQLSLIVLISWLVHVLDFKAGHINYNTNS